MNMNTLSNEINQINRSNGWKVIAPEQWADPHKVPAILALIHSEVSEALEAFRRDDKDNFEEELADTLIRVLDCCGGLGINIDAVVRAKLEKNKTRGLQHGGKRI
jgi:NTP pyrophosphatase (non-canonical NTP hydrolase)